MGGAKAIPINSKSGRPWVSQGLNPSYKSRPLLPYSPHAKKIQTLPPGAFAAGGDTSAGSAKTRARTTRGSDRRRRGDLPGVSPFQILVYQVMHKPTELFFFVGHRLDKEPPETWRQYGSLFRTYSTGTITPELLAALAQDREQRQSGGAHLLALAMELQSVRDLPARLQRRRPLPDDRSGLRRGRAVLHPSQRGLGYRLRLRSPTCRAIPSHAIELASVYLDRNVADDSRPRRRCDAQARSRSRISAAFIHLCGGGPATAFARRKFPD